MAEGNSRNAGFKGRIIRVPPAKVKYARAEPISALYEQGRVANHGNLYVLENQLMEYIPATAKKSPDRLDAMVYALTELEWIATCGDDDPETLFWEVSMTKNANARAASEGEKGGLAYQPCLQNSFR